MKAPTISVLMPVYNAERYLVESIESVLAQSFSDFEFIIIDDGSTDGSLAVLHRYAAQDTRIRLVSRPNTGYVVALNEMLGRARGEFVARMDADDVSLPERFERQVAYLRDQPDVACVGGAIVLMDEAGRLLTALKLPVSDGEIQRDLLSGQASLSHPAVMIRLASLRAIDGYRPNALPAEDIDLFLRLGERFKLSNLHAAVLKYRLHEGSVSHQRQHLQLERVIQIVGEACDRRGLPRRVIHHGEVRRGATDRRSRQAVATRYGWWAFGSGERRTAIRYGWQAIRLIPWRSDGWRLLTCAIVKPVRNLK